METEKTPPKDTSGGRGRTALVVVGVLGAIAVNIAAFIMSATAITAVANAAGIAKVISWAMVPSVDGMMITGTVVFIANKLRGRSVTYPLIVLGAGVLLSIWCNALHAKAGGGHVIQLSSNTKMGVSAIPALALALSFHLIADMVKDSLGLGVASTGASPETSEDAPRERLAEASSHRLPETPQAPSSEASSETLSKPSVQTPAERPKKTTAKTPTAVAAAKTPASKKTTRERAREFLKTDPDMSAAELARKLGRKPSGTYRQMRSELLQELRDAGELPSVRALGA